MLIKISIKSIYDVTLFEYEIENNSILVTLIECFKQKANLFRANLSRAYLFRANLSGANLSGADLSGANLSGANLSGANLSGAYLSGANLSGANLSGAKLSGAKLSGANLSEANLSVADLFRADLSVADLFRADLSGANLSGANLSGANLYGAYLSKAKLSGAKLYGANLELLQIKHLFWLLPDEGDIIGYKKASNCIVKLLIPSKALKSCCTNSRKCRASEAMVISINSLTDNTEKIACISDRGNLFYEVGKTVYPDSFDSDFRNECSNGIHFFITRREAKIY